MKNKIIIIGTGAIDVSIAAKLAKAGEEIIVVSPEDAKTMDFSKTEPFVITNLPEVETLKTFDEPKNYINGKKLPRKKKKK